MRHATLALGLLLCLAAPAVAQDDDQGPPMNVDRPSVASGAYTVGEGVVQLETGFAWTVDKDPASNPTLFNMPQRLRVGLNDEVDLFVDMGLLNIQGPNQGTSDFSPGLKYIFHAGDGGNYGVLLSLQIPSGHPVFQANGLQPTVAFLANWDLDEDTNLGFNAGVFSPVDASNVRTWNPYATLGASRNLGGGWGCYLEVAQYLNPGSSLVNGGFSYQVNDDVIVDAAMFKGLSGSGLDWSPTVGISARF